MLRRLISSMIFAGILITGCKVNGSPNETDAALTPIRLPMGYIPNVQYAPFYVAVEKGYFRMSGLDVTFDYSSETDGVALVGVNELQFTLASGEQVLLARAQGIPVVYVLGWWQDYPVAVASLQGGGIFKPEDLRGKKIGLPGLFGASYVGLRALLDAGGLSEEDVTLDSIGYTQVEAMLAGKDEAVVVYANNEPIQLEKRGYPVDVIRVADYVSLASNGLLTNETTIENNPDLIRRMNQAVMKGITFTLEHPDEAFVICKKYVEGLSQDEKGIQKAVLEASIEFWKTDQLGYSNPVAWENMHEVLLDMGMLNQPLDYSKAYDNSFIGLDQP